MIPIFFTFLSYCFKTANKYHEMNYQSKLEVAQVFMSCINVLVIVPLIFYGSFYADGKKGTSWFSDDEYRTANYPIQTLTMLNTVSFFVADAIVMALLFEPGKGRDIYLHHIVVNVGTLCSVYCGGIIYTVNFINFLVEISTLTLNVRVLMQQFDLNHGWKYTVVGLWFSLQFFWFRIIGTYYIMFTKIYCWMPGFKCYPFGSGKGEYEFIAEQIIKFCYWGYFAL